MGLAHQTRIWLWVKAWNLFGSDKRPWNGSCFARVIDWLQTTIGYEEGNDAYYGGPAEPIRECAPLSR